MDPSLLMIQGESNTFSSSHFSSHVVKPQIDLLLSRIDEELHDMEHHRLGEEDENSKLEWIRKDVDGGSMRQIGPRSFEFEVSSLAPATEYLIKITSRRGADNLTSNTLLVRTFPPGIDSSFSGCFHGNKTYEVGQIFFDGCAYKCTCREGGIRECEERCPVYVDTIGYDDCLWKPAPDDPCCTVPVCERNHTLPSSTSTTTQMTPMSTVATQSSPMTSMTTAQSSPLPLRQFCVLGEEVFAIGRTWQDFSECIKKSCTCLLLPNGTTAIQCMSGCPEIPPSALKPSIECSKPSLITPNNPCLCPYVVCHKSKNRKFEFFVWNFLSLTFSLTLIHLSFGTSFYYSY